MTLQCEEKRAVICLFSSLSSDIPFGYEAGFGPIWVTAMSEFLMEGRHFTLFCYSPAEEATSDSFSTQAFCLVKPFWNAAGLLNRVKSGLSVGQMQNKIQNNKGMQWLTDFTINSDLP